MPKPSDINQAITYIKSNWKQGKSLKQVATQHGVDSGNLARAFRNQERMTVKQFIDEKRERYVMSQLTKRTLYGYEIGAELGFINDLAFYRWVKRAFGVSFAMLRSQALRERTTRKRNKK